MSISIPLVRKKYDKLTAPNLVSVQPLSGPTGLIFYHRFRYGSKTTVSEKQDEPVYKKPCPTYRNLDDEWWSVEA